MMRFVLPTYKNIVRQYFLLLGADHVNMTSPYERGLLGTEAC